MMNLNYDIWLVLLSLLQCSLAMFVTFSFVKRIHLSNEAKRQLLLPVYSTAVGSGIWGIQFVNFIAFENHNTLQFSMPLMLASWLFGWLIGFILCQAASKKYVSFPQLILSGVIAGLCGYAMFYLITVAIYISSQITFDYVQLLISLTLVTVVCLLTIVTLSWMKAYSGKSSLLIKGLLSLITGAAIIGMHLVFSTSITLDTNTLIQTNTIATDKKMLVAVISLSITCVFLLVFAVAMFYEKHGSSLFNFSLFEARKTSEDSLSMLDGLTNLPNRRGFQENLANAISRSERSGKTIALAYIDLDHFKPVNDNYGHLVGDIVLASVANRLSAAIRGCDSLARIGGDEFVAIIEGVKSNEDIMPIAERIVNAIRDPFLIDRQKIEISCSVGIAIYSGNGDIENLMVCADTAMYKAKENGKNQFRFYDAEIASAIDQMIEMQKDLITALDNNDFKLVFQPKLCCATQTLVGAEALIHWQHPTKGWMNPEKFIPDAEQLGLINKVNDWMIKEACRVIYRAKELDIDLNLALNVPQQQFRNMYLVKETIRHFDDYGVPAQNLTMEIKETAVKDEKRFKQLLAEFKTANIKISLDDFGLHPFTLTSLQELNVNEIKLNKAFLSNIDKDSTTKNFAKSIIDLAHALNFNVVADGIETEATRQTLAELGCNHIQGYLMATPISETKLFELLKQQALKVHIQEITYQSDIRQIA